MPSPANHMPDELKDIINANPSVEFEQARFGACLLINNHVASARISLFGGHLLSYVPNVDKRDRLWLSEKAIYDSETPIRGGVPICWPWFGANKRVIGAPSHGFVRTQIWTLLKVQETSNSEGKIIDTVCTLVPSQLGLHEVPKGLELILNISIGSTCEIKLSTYNNSQQTIALSQAIHSYFAISDIQQISIHGLDSNYYNKLDDSAGNLSPKPYQIVGETDRVHSLPPLPNNRVKQNISISENQADMVNIEQTGHNGTVVWNPWINKSRGMKDMSSKGYKKMLCIEAVSEPEILLSPGQQHVLTQQFR
ncbi:D-hexose-6-phosphate mutarotase [Glaciecola sp. SC05]|uniref:D-hexose-6-phosphate mutarotase n=1 Tax=Glaciecola sp. SC05 TaxID=1987355 RepID=UPI003528E021